MLLIGVNWISWIRLSSSVPSTRTTGFFQSISSSSLTFVDDETKNRFFVVIIAFSKMFPLRESI